MVTKTPARPFLIRFLELLGNRRFFASWAPQVSQNLFVRVNSASSWYEWLFYKDFSTKEKLSQFRCIWPLNALNIFLDEPTHRLLNFVSQFGSEWKVRSKEGISILCEAQRKTSSFITFSLHELPRLRRSQIICNTKIMNSLIFSRTCCNSFWFFTAFRPIICKRGRQHHSWVELHHWRINCASTVFQCNRWWSNCSQVWRWRCECGIWLPRTIQGWYLKDFGTVDNSHSAKIRQWTL